MRIIKIIILLLLILILGTNVNANTPEITATSATVIDGLDGKFLYTKNADEKLYPGSMTNLLTAILVVENCDMNEDVVISQNAINKVQSGYLTANIKAGEILKVEQLLNLIVISSYSDVSNALAEHVAGSTEEFVNMMNQKSLEIGCTNSNFTNCNGEHDVNHYSTAHDMALIGKYAMQYDEIKNIVGKISYEIGETNQYKGKNRLYETSNEMILRGSNNYYKYAKGIKVSFTTPAGYCIMAYAEKNDMPLVAVVMKATTSDSRYEDAKKIMEYSYDNNTIKTIAELGSHIQTLNIKNATRDTQKLNVILEKTIYAVVNIANEDKNIEPQISLYKNIKAPIKKGDVVGTVSYEIEGKEYKANLIAETEVQKSHSIIYFIFIFIGILIVIGFLRIRGLYNRNKILNKVRKK